MTFSHQMAHAAVSQAHALSSEDSAHLRRILNVLGIPVPPTSNSAAPFISTDPVEQLHQKAGWIQEMRTKRSRVLPDAMLGEPAWDIMIGLFMAHGRQRMTLTSLANITGTAQTTLMRWLRTLSEMDLISSVPSTTDARVTIIDLSGKGLASMTAFLRDIPAAPN